MPRRPNVDDPVAAIRALLRELRASRRMTTSPLADRLCPHLPPDKRQPVMLSIVRLALYRLSPRQREVLRRYDIDGEPAARVQSALGLSPRQFFRDRRVALAQLTDDLLGATPPQLDGQAPPLTDERTVRAVAEDARVAPRTLARSLEQSGSDACVGVLWDLARQVTEPAQRVALMLDTADLAADYERRDVVLQAEHAATTTLECEALDEGIRELLIGRRARVRARLAAWGRPALALYPVAIDQLRRCVARDPANVEARWALTNALGDFGLLHFGFGAFVEARYAATEAADLINEFGFMSRPRSLELLAFEGSLAACFCGTMRASIEQTTRLLAQAIDAGWCATACRLGTILVDLNAIRGTFEEAVRWHLRMAALPMMGGRPLDRTDVFMQAAQAYTMLRRPGEALQLLSEIRPGNGCPPSKETTWHALASAALERGGRDAEALREAQIALAGYTERQTARGIGDGHRLVAVSAWKLGDAGTAREHIREAQRLVDRYGTPYAMLRTLVARSAIENDLALKRDAVDLARMLTEIDETPRDSRNLA